MTQILILCYTVPTQKVVMPCNHLLQCLRTGAKESQHLDVTATAIINFLFRPQLSPRQEQFCSSAVHSALAFSELPL